MALDQSALLEVLEALNGAQVDDRIRQAAENDLPGADWAELSSAIGALRHEPGSTCVARRIWKATGRLTVNDRHGGNVPVISSGDPGGAAGAILGGRR